MTVFNHFHSLWCSADFALHGWLTGRKNEKDIARALELGADDYMTKPFSIVELEARVKRWASRMLGEKSNA